MGAILSDTEIHVAIAKGELQIKGWTDLYVGPSSLDMHLDNKAMILDDKKVTYSIIEAEDGIKKTGIDASDKRKSSDLFSPHNGWDFIILYPREFYLLSTVESIKFPNDIVGFIQGRSSIARIGINVHNAGYFDAGFEGTATLEVTNLTNYPIKLAKHTRICQMVFARTGEPASIPYHMKRDQKYQGQQGPTLTGAHKDFGDADERSSQLI